MITYLPRGVWKYFHFHPFDNNWRNNIRNDYKKVSDLYPDFLKILSAQQATEILKRPVNDEVVAVFIIEEELQYIIDKIINEGKNSDSDRAFNEQLFFDLNNRFATGVIQDWKLNCDTTIKGTDKSIKRGECRNAKVISHLPALLNDLFAIRLQQYQYGLFDINFNLKDKNINHPVNEKLPNAPKPVLSTGNTISQRGTLMNYNVPTIIEQETKTENKNFIIVYVVVAITIIYILFTKLKK